MIFEVRDLWPEVPIAMGVLKGKVSRRLARLLAKVAYANAQAVIALSPDMAKGVRSAGYEGPIEVIPNACDVDVFGLDDSHGREFRAQRPWLGQRQLVLYAGTFGAVNGLEYMADLAAHTIKLDPEVRFLAIGDGACLEPVRAHAKSLGVLDRNFFIEPAMPKRDVAHALNAATVCTSWVVPVPELEANSANKVFDALAAGRPIVINHGGWISELIDEHSIGIQLSQSDKAAAGEALVALLSDAEQLRSARSGAAALAAEEFSRDRLNEDLFRLIERVHDCARSVAEPIPGSLVEKGEVS